MTAAAAAAPPAASISSPAGRDPATLRGRAIAARSPPRRARRAGRRVRRAHAVGEKAPFNGEFGPELVTALPHAYFLHACGKLRATSSCGDLSDFYWFSPRHVAKACVAARASGRTRASSARTRARTRSRGSRRRCARVRETRADVFAGRFGAATPSRSSTGSTARRIGRRPRHGAHHVCKPYPARTTSTRSSRKSTPTRRAHRSPSPLRRGARDEGLLAGRWNVMADGAAAAGGPTARPHALVPAHQEVRLRLERGHRGLGFLRAHHPAVVKTRDREHRAEWNARRRARVERLLHLLLGSASHIAAFFGSHALVADFFEVVRAGARGAARAEPPPQLPERRGVR